MAFTVVTGLAEIDNALRRFAENVQQRVSRNAVRAGGQVIVNRAQQLAPVGRSTKARQRAIESAAKKKGRQARRLRESVGIKNVKDKGRVTSIKVSVAAYHGHFVTLGVADRQKNRMGLHARKNRRDRLTLKGGRLEDTDRLRIGGKFAWNGTGKDPRNKGTGRMRPRPFFRQAHQSLGQIVRMVIVEKLTAGIEREIAAL